MQSSEKAPALSFQCPKLWQDLSGSETKRFCEQCRHHVHNLSLLGDETRQQLLERAKTERICGTFHQDLAGNLVTADSPEELSKKVRNIRLAAIASGALALTACSANKIQQREPVPPPGSTTPVRLGYMCPPESQIHSEIPHNGPIEPYHKGGALGKMMEGR